MVKTKKKYKPKMRINKQLDRMSVMEKGVKRKKRCEGEKKRWESTTLNQTVQIQVWLEDSDDTL